MFAALSIGTSPSISLAIISESRAKGRLSDLVLGAAVVKDVVVVVCLAIAVAIAQALTSGGELGADVLVHESKKLGATILAGSIGEAMNCTQFGLIASIPLLIAFSVLNGRTQHLINDINETQKVSVEFPIIADEDRKVSTLYEFIHPNASATATVRSLVIIGPDKLVKLIITYPASTGRNFNEVLRVLDSLQLTANHSVATPADWKEGEDVIVVPSISTEDAQKKFPKGVKVIKPYLRYTPQPNK